MSNMKEGEYMKGFYTVSQYATIFGKDSGNIRRMLINGTLEGEKVGKQWLIPKTAKLAEDRRLKSGKYRNWRNKIRINNKHPQILKQLSDMCKKIGEIYEDVIDNIVLYGSYVRGQETPDSDIDISVISIEKDNFNEWNSTLPFYKNLLKEGISLWKNERENYQSTALKQA